MARALKILAIHGIGHQEAKLDEWVDDWRLIIDRGLKSAARTTETTEVTPQFEFFFYDQLFEKPSYPVNGRAYLQALRELGAGMLARDMAWSAPGARGWWQNFTQGIRWTVGMVAQWVAYPRLRQELNAALQRKIHAMQPDVIVAHSLGTLIAYDTLAQVDNVVVGRPKVFLSCGSQIGHPAVLGSVFGGRVKMPSVESWFHLFNPFDRVFTAELRVPDEDFGQIETRFDTPREVTNHSAIEYLRHSNIDRAWEAIVSGGQSETMHRDLKHLFKQARKSGRMFRALIIGIDEYANPQANLEGCANDAFLMSATLQEIGFPAEQIRVILNDRATSVAIRDRLEWLLDDVQPGDVRFLHYSGHGAQIPAYGPNAEIDQFDECLAAHDFDWTAERAILDDWFYERYSQLPYDARFIAVFDCCHSGGLTRAGGIRVRGLNPPDDIRHRAIQFNSQSGWRPRELESIELGSTRRNLKRELTGRDGTTHRLGGALPLRRTQSTAEYRQSRQRYEHRGPYLPVLMHACAETELAEEVRIGSTTHGAFTYHVTNALHRLRRTNPGFSFNKLLTETLTAMSREGLTQTPQLVGPTAVLSQAVPAEPVRRRPTAKAKAKPQTPKSKLKPSQLTNRKQKKGALQTS